MVKLAHDLISVMHARVTVMHALEMPLKVRDA